ncbi:MAG: hypothetical protein ACJAYG_001310 [Oceanicoccus sp.]|jgi:hypothetical protein
MADNITKVVPISSRSQAGRSSGMASAAQLEDNHLLARLPAPFADMKVSGKQAFQPLLQALFDNIDDALFELADRAVANAEQNMYFESMREIRIKRRGMEMGFGRELDEAFQRLLAVKDNLPTLTAADEVDVDSLSLVAADELEELLAADNMVAKAQGKCADALAELTAGLNTLVSNCELSDNSNPFGPVVICRAFTDVCKDLDLDIKAKLVLFKLFDRYVVNNLESVYQICNQVLKHGGVVASSAGQPFRANVLSPQQRSDVFADLQGLLHNTAQAGSFVGAGLSAPGQAPQVPRGQLLQLLQSLQRSLMPQMQQQQIAAVQGAVPQQFNVQASLSDLLAEKMPKQPVSIGQVDDDAINLVAMLFQFILDDRNLAAPMKALISRLQIPIIKVAMVDKSFFSKTGHPARKLLNEIASASLGWIAPEAIDRDPLYNKVTELVNHIIEQFDGDTGLFQNVLADFMVFQVMDQRRIDLVQQRTINAEDGKAKSELARSTVQQALNARVLGKALPAAVIAMLEQAWSNVLFLICLKDGEDSDGWKSSLQLVDDLLWSVQPMETQPARQRLLTLLPSLLKKLRAGLSQIGFDPFESNKLFNDLEVIHLQQLNPSTLVAAESAVELAKHRQIEQQQARVLQTQAIGKTLDQLLEERGDDDINIEQLDAELDQQLAAADVLSVNIDGRATLDDPPQAAATGIRTVAGIQTLQVVEKLNLGDPEDKPVEEELAADDPYLAKVDAMSMGHWVELHQQGEKKFRCRLAAVIKSAGKYIFVNRTGMKVAEYSRVSLALAIKQRQITTLDEGLLFDRALESVIGNLREMKTAGE